MKRLTDSQFSEMRKWIHCLEETRLPQCTHALRRMIWDVQESCWVDGFCPFGVYAYYNTSTQWEFDVCSGMYFLDKTYQRGLPWYLSEQVGITLFHQIQLSQLNDELGYSFTELAQWMKQNFL